MTKTISSALWSGQAVALQLIKADLLVQGFSICKAGMRSGKTVLAAALTEGYSAVCFPLAEASCDALELKGILNAFSGKEVPSSFFFCLGAPELNKIEDKSKILFIQQEPFWRTNSIEDFKVARECGYHVLVIGSNGPGYNDEWKALGGHGYNTWDLNPRVPKDDDTLAAEKKRDPVRFSRDFCAF